MPLFWQAPACILQTGTYSPAQARFKHTLGYVGMESSAFLDKRSVTFRAGDFNLSLSPGNPDFLLAARTGVDMVDFSLTSQILFPSKPTKYLLLHSKESGIFLIALAVIFGKHTEINPNETDYQQKADQRGVYK